MPSAGSIHFQLFDLRWIGEAAAGRKRAASAELHRIIIDEKWEARDAVKRCALAHSRRPDSDHTDRVYSDTTKEQGNATFDGALKENIRIAGCISSRLSHGTCGALLRKCRVSAQYMRRRFLKLAPLLLYLFFRRALEHVGHRE